MSNPDELLRILREKYGIENDAQFREEYSKLRPLDIALFAAPLPKGGNKNGRKSETRSNRIAGKQVAASANA